MKNASLHFSCNAVWWAIIRDVILYHHNQRRLVTESITEMSQVISLQLYEYWKWKYSSFSGWNESWIWWSAENNLQIPTTYGKDGCPISIILLMPRSFFFFFHAFNTSKFFCRVWLITGNSLYNPTKVPLKGNVFFILQKINKRTLDKSAQLVEPFSDSLEC